MASEMRLYQCKAMDQHELVVRVLSEAGGVNAEELLAPEYRGKRADIVFQAESLIAEVKSLTSDRRQYPGGSREAC